MRYRFPSAALAALLCTAMAGGWSGSLGAAETDEQAEVKLTPSKDARTAYLQELYGRYLRAQGYKLEAQDDDQLVFSDKAFRYAIVLYPQDEQYFQMALPNFWALESPGERARAYMAANRAGIENKACKIGVVESNVWAYSELFLANAEAFTTIFPRAREAMVSCAREFATIMRAAQEP